MKRFSAGFGLLLLLACGRPEGPVVSKEPISVRGWVIDVEGSQNPSFHTVETEAARKMQLFQSTNVWIDGAPYVSGGVQENGAFLLLDVPPGNVTITFSAPGVPEAKLVFQNIPGNADVFVPSLLLKKGGVQLLDPAGVKVRMAAHVDKPQPTRQFAIVAGLKVPVVDTPYAQMDDRHDFPVPPSLGRVPLATVR